jgi:predicted phosphodiesterase
VRVLVIGDVHSPVEHPGYIHFCRDLHAKYRCNQTVFIGDLVDWHSISLHPSHPEAPGPTDEYNLTLPSIARWVKAFPEAKVCIGNHDSRIIRLAASVKIPAAFIRSYKEIWETPDWEWADEFILDEVFYFHGTGNGGMHPAFNSMRKMLMSVVQGHIHSAAGLMTGPRRSHTGNTRNSVRYWLLV